MVHRVALLALGLLAAVVLAAPGARAGGFEYELQGANTVARAGANVAHVEDPSTLYLNVAGIGKLDDVQILLDLNLVDVDSAVTIGGNLVDSWEVSGVEYPYMTVENDDPVFPGPMIAASFGIPGVEGLVLGLGVFGPAAVGNYTYDVWVEPEGGVRVPGPQRYDLIREKVLFYWPTVAIAYRILPGLVVGAGFQWGILDFEYEVAGSIATVRNPGSWQSDFLASVHALDWFVPAGLVGVSWQPLPWLEAGLSLRLSGKVEAKSKKTEVVVNAWMGDDAVSSNDPTLDWMDAYERPHGNVSFAWPLLKLRTGVRFALPRGDVKAPEDGGPVPAHLREWFDVELAFFLETSGQVDAIDMRLDGFAPYDRAPGSVIPLNPTEDGLFSTERGWKHCWSLRLGGDVNLWDGHISLGWGVFFDRGAAPEAYTRLDYMAFDRWGLSTGIVGRFWKLEVRFSYAHFFYPRRVVTDGAITHLQATGTEGTVINNGTYEASIDVFTVGVAARF